MLGLSRFIAPKVLIIVGSTAAAAAAISFAAQYIHSEHRSNENKDQARSGRIEQCDEAISKSKQVMISGLSTGGLCAPAVFCSEPQFKEFVPDLTRATVDFLEARFSDSPESFVEWREKHHYTLRPRSELDRQWPIADSLSEYRGKPVSSGESVRALFVDALRSGDAFRDGRQRVVAVSFNTDWSIVLEKRTALQSSSADGSKDRLPSWLEDPGFRTRQSLTCFQVVGSSQSWWNRGPMYADRSRSDSGVIVATVSFFATFEDRKTLPMAIVLFLDPGAVDGQKWTVDSIAVAAHTMDDVRRIEF